MNKSEWTLKAISKNKCSGPHVSNESSEWSLISHTSKEYIHVVQEQLDREQARKEKKLVAKAETKIVRVWKR